MDIAKLDTVAQSNSGFEAPLHHPGTLVDLGIFITVLGRDSTEFRRVSAEQNRKRVAKIQKAGGTQRVALTVEELESDSLDLLAACTKSWRQVDEKGKESKTLTVGGTEIECTRDNARKLYSEYPWIKEQVDSAVTDRSNFSKR